MTPPMTAAAIAAEPRRGQRQHRAEPLAAGGDEVAGELRDQRHRALHALEDEGVDLPQVLADELDELIQRRLSRLPPLLLQADDDRQDEISPEPFLDGPSRRKRA